MDTFDDTIIIEIIFVRYYIERISWKILFCLQHNFPLRNEKLCFLQHRYNYENVFAPNIFSVIKKEIVAFSWD